MIKLPADHLNPLSRSSANHLLLQRKTNLNKQSNRILAMLNNLRSLLQLKSLKKSITRKL